MPGTSPPIINAVLVASDLSKASDALVQQASALAARGGADLHVVSVYSSPTSRFGEDPEVPEAVMTEIREALPAQLRRILPDSGRPASEEVRFGSPATVILERARETRSDLIVLGAHRGRDVNAQFLGTTADEVLRETEIPCLVLRGRFSMPLARIGVATDFSAIGTGALERAVDWAAWLGSGAAGEDGVTLCAAHVLHPSERDEETDCRARLEQAIEDACRQAGESASSVVPEPEILVGSDAPSALIDWVKGGRLDLLAAGTHGKSGWQRSLLGSTSSALARRAPCPVLLVPRSDGSPMGDGAENDR
ncbi:MAG: universal stress protein [Gemmatimonadota bacterium]